MSKAGYTEYSRTSSGGIIYTNPRAPPHKRWLIEHEHFGNKYFADHDKILEWTVKETLKRYERYERSLTDKAGYHMTKPAPTLIDELYRLSCRTKPVNGWRSNDAMRHALNSARRFVVSDKMSAFMADLTNEAFMISAVSTPVRRRRAYKLADSLRISSRLPHEAIWIEYNLHAYQTRSHVIRDLGPPDIPQIPEREGWLIHQHPKIETACIMHLFTKDKRVHEDGNDMWTFPFAFGWTCDGSQLPWHVYILETGDYFPSEFLVGLVGYERSNVNLVRSPLIDEPSVKLEMAYRALLIEWTGVIRRVWSLLATLDHLPVLRHEVKQSRGFLARGQIRKYLDHTTITLNIPAKKDTRVVARKAIAITHRKRHEVRAFWRDDFRHPPKKTCNPHLWEMVGNDADHIECTTCKGRQVHVHKHMRGDASLGYVTHDYKLKHNEEDAA